eukprot:CAMPEP_0185041966 /NCGR_PEP_ID=MMETSP1103-20130426/41895_1 /TAXON_ID=36769 /ORGANISM="Paraphysomonas bandaiensis, Strain Caron Lab Isolate" /LENGTH=86 /DNA_ID=CAMNT_0027581917 /DNA_START=46 /DNA_END=303 /DNA_ORIENTATION=+
MREIYKQTWGWDEKQQWDDMFSDKSCFLLLVDGDDEVQAYTHYQFTWDDEDEPEYPVLYCYELMVDNTCQGTGLGRILMKSLATIA